VRPKPKKVANNEIGTGKPIAKVKLVQKSATLLRKKGSGTKINKQLDLKRRKVAERKQKQRLRIKLDRDAHEKVKEYDLNRKKKAKDDGKLLPIGNRSRREQKSQRKIWRDSSSRYRKKQRTAKESNIGDVEMSASELRIAATKCRDRRKLRAKHAREVKLLKEQLKRSETLAEKWKKRCNRSVISTKSSPTPRKIVKEIMTSGPKTVRRRLLFGEVLCSQLKKSNNAFSSIRQKQFLAKTLAAGKLWRRYKCGFMTAGFLRRHYLRKYSSTLSMDYDRRPRRNCLGERHRIAVSEFLEEDDNSCVAPGKRDCVTKSKNKKQKRYITDSLKQLHRKFCEATTVPGAQRLSYASFCRLKPFWIVDPKHTVRDTCLCIKHANMEFILGKLHQLKLIESASTSHLTKTLCCNDNDRSCMYGECLVCGVKKLAINVDDGLQVTFSCSFHNYNLA